MKKKEIEIPDIPDDYVTFDTAQLLMEAGYPQDKVYCKHYDREGFMMASKYDCGMEEDAIAAPHLWTALAWLRDERRIHVCTNRKHWGNTGWTCLLIDTDGETAIPQKSLYKTGKDENGVPQVYDVIFPSYQSACDAAIAEACRWLINRNKEQ